MNLAPLLPFWFLPVLPLLAIGTFIVWVTRRDRRKALYREATGDMLLDRLRQANAKLSAFVKAENDAIQSILVLPDAVAPLEAERILQAAMPGSSVQDRHALMLHVWDVQKRPQALAALAGMALADLSGTYAILQRTFQRVLKEGGPALLDQVAAELVLRRDQLDAWLQTGGLIVSLERAALRVEQSVPQVAENLREAVRRLKPRCLELMMTQLRFQIESWEARDDIAPLEMAGALAAYSSPLFPELAAEAHRALDRHEGAEWERAHIWFDKAVLHKFYDVPGALDGFDFDAALNRLCAGIMADDAETSRFAAESAADLLSDYFYDRAEYRAALQTALNWAAQRHAFTPSHDWLHAELNPPEVTEENLRQAEASLEQQRQANAGTRALAEMTATLDPIVALAELRGIMPDVPVDMLRVSLVARWKEKPSPIWLAALVGLALEELDKPDADGKMVQLCLYWPLKEGNAAAIAAITEALDARFAQLDGWMQAEGGVRNLRQAGQRIAGQRPDTGAQVDRLLARVETRLLPLLERAIQNRLEQEKGRDGDEHAFQLAYDLHRLCLPGESALEAPVRAFMEQRGNLTVWREALLHFENLRANYFGAHDALGKYDFAYLMDRLTDGLHDENERVRQLAAALAAKLVDRGVLTDRADFIRLEDEMGRVDDRPDSVSGSFASLRKAIAAKRDFPGARD